LGTNGSLLYRRRICPGNSSKIGSVIEIAISTSRTRIYIAHHEHPINWMFLSKSTEQKLNSRYTSALKGKSKKITGLHNSLGKQTWYSKVCLIITIRSIRFYLIIHPESRWIYKKKFYIITESFDEVSKNLARSKIILLESAKNYIKRSKLLIRMLKLFASLLLMLEFPS